MAVHKNTVKNMITLIPGWQQSQIMTGNNYCSEKKMFILNLVHQNCSYFKIKAAGLHLNGSHWGRKKEKK